MNRQRVIAALLAAGIVGACGNNATPAPSSAANADASQVAVASTGPSASAEPSPSPSPSPTPTTEPTATALPTPTPTATPAPTPIPWKTYTSKRFHYKISYPPDWIVTPGSATRSDAFDGFGYPYVYVTRDTVTNQVSISRTVSAEIAYFHSHYKTKVLSNVAITLAGWPGRLLTLSGVDNGVKVVIKEVIIGKGKVGYFITMWGEATTAPADRIFFRKMYLTWRATA